MKTSCGTDEQRQSDAAIMMGFSCCPLSERHWFKWGMLAQPVIAVALLALAYFGLL